MTIDEIEDALQAYTDAARRVAEAAKGLERGAEKLSERRENTLVVHRWLISNEDMKTLQKALKSWAAAGDTIVQIAQRTEKADG